jgi:surface antigen
MKKRLSRPLLIPALSLVIILSLLALNASAINLMFLSKETPARRFSDEDWQYLNRAIAYSLENVEDGSVYHWNNPASPAYGQLELLESLHRDGRFCRRARLTNFFDDIKGVAEFLFCKQPKGEWKVVE